jgi:shikimate dehydrogenase
MQKYGLIGRTLKHSLSPVIHNTAFQALNLNASYQIIEINPDNFDYMVAQLKKEGFSGFNVTIPYKRRIISFLDRIDSDAQIVAAVNTIYVDKGKWHGFNTDIQGFLAPLSNLQQHFKNCIILGSGGAARAVIFALIKYLSPQEITVACRNTTSGEKLQQQFLPYLKNISCVITHLAGIGKKIGTADLIINTTPVGMSPDVHDSPLKLDYNAKKEAVFYDLIYNPPQTKFLAQAKKAGEGIHTINGMAMLLSQAAHSFELWTGKKFPLNAIKGMIQPS